MSDTAGAAPARPSYFDLYPERKPKASGAAASPSSSSSTSTAAGKQKEPPTSTTRNLFHRSSRSGSISGFVNVGNGKEKERDGSREAPAAARRPSATSSLFAKAFGSSSADAKMEAALGLRRGSGGGMPNPARRGSESAASVASSSSSSSRSGSRSRGGSTRPPSTRQRTSGSASASASTFPSPRSSPRTSFQPTFPTASTSAAVAGPSNEPPVPPPPRSASLAPSFGGGVERSTRRTPSLSSFPNDIFPSKPRPASGYQSSSSQSSAPHTFPPPPRSHSSSTFSSSSHSGPKPTHHTSVLDFDDALDALFDSQDRPERPNSLLSRSSRGGVTRPISTVFPSRPGSSTGGRSIRTFESASSLRSTSVRRSSLGSIVSEEDGAPSERPAEDLFAGPGETKLEFDERSGTYVAPPPRASGLVIGQVGGVDALVESMGSLGRRRKSGTSLGAAAKKGEEEARERERELSASTLASEGSFASMKAGPTAGHLMMAPGMDRDANATLRPDVATAVGEQGRLPSAPSIEDIIRAHGAMEPPPPTMKGATSWGWASPPTPTVEGGESSNATSGPAVSAVPFPPTTPRRASATALPVASFTLNGTVSSPPLAPAPTFNTAPAPSTSLFSAALPPLRYGSTAASTLRPSTPPRPRESSPPPPVPSSLTNDALLPVEFTPPPISDPVFPSQPTRIKTIDEIIREHGGVSSKQEEPQQQSPAQILAAAARSREDSVPSEGEPRSSVDSVTEEIVQTLALQSALEREEEAEVAKLGTSRKRGSGSLGKSFSFRLPRSASSSTALPLSDLQDDARSIKSTKSSHSTHATSTPRPSSPASFAPEALAIERELATLLKSSRLTRIISLRRAPNQGLNVSLADVGSPTGHPVIVFLGLGCVRYLVALYEEMAEAFGLRLICLDRWGLGRTGEVPDERRGFTEWASVVEEVVDQMGLHHFSLLAHSAGAPYALATSLRSQDKVHGSIHLLAPWVSTSADSLAGAYKYLKFVPSGVIKTAQAAEWKMQAWRLGKPPTITHAPIGYDHRAGVLSSDPPSPATQEGFDALSMVSIMAGDVERMSEMKLGGGMRGNGGRPALKPKGSKSFLGGLFGAGAGTGAGGGGGTSERSSPKSSDGSDGNSLRAPTGSASRRSSYYASSSSLSTPPPRPLGGASATLSPRVASPTNGHPTPPPNRRASILSSSSLGSSSTPTSITNRRDSLTSPISPAPPTPTSTLSGTDLANGLLRASYAESLRGGTSDLMVILERTAKPWGFRYGDVERRVKVWHGERDERISLSSVKGLEEEMRRCEVKVVEGADHSLMTNGRVMVEVLESIAAEWG